MKSKKLRSEIKLLLLLFTNPFDSQFDENGGERAEGERDDRNERGIVMMIKLHDKLGFPLA